MSYLHRGDRRNYGNGEAFEDRGQERREEWSRGRRVSWESRKKEEEKEQEKKRGNRTGKLDVSELEKSIKVARQTTKIQLSEK